MVKRPFAGSSMSSKLARIRKVNCPECEGQGCWACKKTGDVRDAYERAKEDYENEGIENTRLSDQIIGLHKALAVKIGEEKELALQVESLYGALLELEGDPITPSEACLIRNTRMMTQSAPTIDGEQNPAMQRAMHKVVHRPPGLGDVIFQYLDEIEVENCDHGPDGHCTECWERDRKERQFEREAKKDPYITVSAKKPGKKTARRKTARRKTARRKTPRKNLKETYPRN